MQTAIFSVLRFVSIVPQIDEEVNTHHKNSNVEQKNLLVRAYLDYDRLDPVAQVLAANQLCGNMGVYYNLFQPVMHLAEKETIYTRTGTGPGPGHAV
jgi:hypothetical protein